MLTKIRLVIKLVILLSASSALCAQSQNPYLYVLGVAQDAGFPQVGCYAAHCMKGWNDPSERITPTAIAVIDADGGRTYLFEATPQIPQQLFMLHQQAPAHKFLLDGIFITHAHIGHYAGLMYLGREAMGAKKMPVYAMPKMATFLRDNGPWSQLIELENIHLKSLSDDVAESFKNFSVTPFIVPHRDEYSETVGFTIEGPARTALFIPDINKWSQWDESIVEKVTQVDYALLDATFFDDGELPGRDMSKIPHPFVTETMDLLKDLPAEQRNKVWFIHMNHTNPLLDPNSRETNLVESQGFNIARPGLRLEL